MHLNEGHRAITAYLPDSYLRQLIQEHRQFYRTKIVPHQPTEPIIELAVNETTARFVQTLLAFFSQEVPPVEAVLEERFRELFYALLTNPNNHSLVTVPE